MLGTGMPSVPVFQVNASPRSVDELVAASYGRGAYRIGLAAHTLSGAAAVGPGAARATGIGLTSPGASGLGGSTGGAQANPGSAASVGSIGWVAGIAGLIVLLAVGGLVVRRRPEDDTF